MDSESSKKRALRPAAHRFAAMLIEEVRAVTGMTYPEITHALFVEGYPKNPNGKEVDRDRAEEYTLPLSHPRSRTPGFDELQLLETMLRMYWKDQLIRLSSRTATSQTVQKIPPCSSSPSRARGLTGDESEGEERLIPIALRWRMPPTGQHMERLSR